MPVTQNEQENKSNAFPSTSYENYFPEDCIFLYVYKFNTFAPKRCSQNNSTLKKIKYIIRFFRTKND
jgi:hypothetical protein